LSSFIFSMKQTSKNIFKKIILLKSKFQMSKQTER
jgi:hypothetical protein